MIRRRTHAQHRLLHRPWSWRRRAAILFTGGGRRRALSRDDENRLVGVILTHWQPMRSGHWDVGRTIVGGDIRILDSVKSFTTKSW